MHLVFIGGSLREASLNRRLMTFLARQSEAEGHPVTVFQGEALRLPLFEEGLPMPAAVGAMVQALRLAKGVVVVSPEYNSGIPGHLKNAVDWLSVQRPSPWTGLPVLMAAASPGAFGGARGILAWRATLANMGCWVAPGAITVSMADRNLAADGSPMEPRTAATVESTLQGFLAMVEAFPSR